MQMALLPCAVTPHLTLPMNARKLSGVVVMLAAFFYSRLSTEFFGNNWWPQSAEELVTDGLGLVVMALGLLIYHGGRD